MKIDELIRFLGEDVSRLNDLELYDISSDVLKAASTIKLLWEIAQDNSNAKYKMQIDEWRGDDAIHAEKH